MALFLISSFAIVTSTLGFPDGASTHINIHMPVHLHKTSPDGSGYPHQAAKFGPLGSHHSSSSYGSMALNVYLAEEDDNLCNWPVNKSGGFPRRGYYNDNTVADDHDYFMSKVYADFAKNGSKTNNKTTRIKIMKPWKSPFILMATRHDSSEHDGGCTFVTQARHAQMAGASALLIADNRCLCQDHFCVNHTTAAAGNSSNKFLPCQASEPILFNDGSGGDVSIPTFLLKKIDSQHIQNTLKRNTPILMDIRWHPPKVTVSPTQQQEQQQQQLNYTLYMDPMDELSRKLLNDLRPVALGLAANNQNNRVRAQLASVHWMLYNGSHTNCVGNAGTNQSCDHMCTNDGRYCYPSAHGISGSSVVKEILRRACIWKHYNGFDEQHNENNKEDLETAQRHWWDYITYFDQFCSGQNDTFGGGDDDDDEQGGACVQDAYAHAQVNADDIHGCMKDSGGSGIQEDAPNSLLDELLETKEKYGLIVAPTVKINHKILHEVGDGSNTDFYTPPSASTIFKAICEGYKAKVVDGSGQQEQEQEQEQALELLLPQVCIDCADAQDVTACADARVEPAPKSHHHHKRKKGRGWRVTFMVLLLLGVVGFVVYKKYFQDGEGGDSLRNFRYNILSGGGGGDTL